METSPARPLIVTCGVAMALFDLGALLPGNPVVTSVGGFVAAAAVQALIIWRLLHGSGLAWTVLVLLSGSYTAMSVLVGGPWETTLVLSGLLALLQVVLVCTPPVLAYVFGEDNAVASH
jgi:hypothetical protein